MSFSGFYQILCEDGHYSTQDAYAYPDFVGDMTDLWTCSCGKRAVWYNLVDCTNGTYCLSWDFEKSVCLEVPSDDGNFCNREQQKRCKELNGRIDGYIELELQCKEEISICPCCGTTKIIKEKTYKIPAVGGHKI